MAQTTDIHSYMYMKPILSFLALCAALVAVPVRAARPAVDYLALAREVADGECAARQASTATWDGATATWGNAWLRLYDVSGDSTYLERAKTLADELVDEEGTISGYEKERYDLRDLQGGAFLYRLYQHNKGGERYLNAQMHLREQLYRQPRTADRLFVCAGTDTVRLEGLYDAMPFYCMYAAMFDQSKVFDDIVLQYEVTHEHTLDASTGLNYGACRDGRAAAREPDMRQTGLYMAGLTDVLEYFPWDHPFREKAGEMLARMAQGLSRCRTGKHTLWGAVPNRAADAVNPVSFSGTAAALYAEAKGVRLGYLDKKEWKKAQQAFGLLAAQMGEWQDDAEACAWFVLAAAEMAAVGK